MARCKRGRAGRAAVGADVEVRAACRRTAAGSPSGSSGSHRAPRWRAGRAAARSRRGAPRDRDRRSGRGARRSPPASGSVPGSIERLAVEGVGRAQSGRRLSRIERHAGRVAVHVDDGARDRRADTVAPRSARSRRAARSTNRRPCARARARRGRARYSAGSVPVCGRLTTSGASPRVTVSQSGNTVLITPPRS